jgi:formylglycine-generating enzyme required for sulfatase activity
MEKKLVVQDVRLAIYWKSLNELDLYRNNHTVETVSGSEVQTYLKWMQDERIAYEIID